MEGAVIGFLIGSILVGLISFYLSRMILRAELIDMVDEQTSKQIKNLEFENSYLERKVYIANKQKDIAINDAKKTLIERNEALIMLSNKLK